MRDFLLLLLGVLLTVVIRLAYDWLEGGQRKRKRGGEKN
jgi:hypothetical protein